MLHPLCARRLAAMALLVAATACSRNVLFVPRPVASAPATTALVFDRYGDLYPGAAVPVDTAFLRTRRDDAAEELRLSTWFLSTRRAQPETWSALLRDAGVSTIPDTTPDSVAWATVQDGLRRQLLARIDAQTRAPGASRRPLVVLIHGFNNDAAGAAQWYEPMRAAVRQRVPDATFLDVYWDGLVASGAPFFIWSRAQYNFPLVGLEFRRILSALDARTPVRVITHSSGGPLIASTLGDASAALPAKDPVYARYRHFAKGEHAPYQRTFPSDLRVGMIVPAASPVTFARFAGDTTGPSRLVFGLNSRDYAVTKTIVPCGFKGSTCLGSHPEAFCREVRPAFSGNRAVALHVFDFSHSRVNRARSAVLWENHSMLEYLKRDDMAPFLDLLLLDRATRDESREICGS